MSTMNVFALTREAPDAMDVSGRRIEFVRFGNIVAAVERGGARPQISEAALRAQHEIVMRIAAAVEALLPARFGAFVDERELAELLTIRQAAIESALDQVRGRAQMTIRIRDNTATRREPATPAAAHASGTAYLNARRAATQCNPPPGAPALVSGVAHLVAVERCESSQRGGTTSVYHLIARTDVAEYLRILSTASPGAFTVTGPWPPFAFAPDLWP